MRVHLDEQMDVVGQNLQGYDLGSLPRSSLMYQPEQSFLHAAGEKTLRRHLGHQTT